MKDDSKLTPDDTKKAAVAPVIDRAATRPTRDLTAFALAQPDEVEVEVGLLRKNPDFFAFLRELSHEDGSIPLEDRFPGDFEGDDPIHSAPRSGSRRGGIGGGREAVH